MHRAALVLAVIVLAGCAGGGQPPGASCATCPAGTTLDSSGNWTLAPPAWHVGDWWNFTGTLGGGSFSHIVTAETAAEWFLDTDNPSSAFRNTQSDTSYLGPIRKSDLAGSQADDRVEYLKWPLVQNATWTTKWDHTSMNLKGRFVVNVGPKPQDDGLPAYYVEARQLNGTLYASYAFTPALGWFRNVTFYDGHGVPQFAFALANFGHNYPGTYVRWRTQSVADVSGALTDAPTTGNFDVPLNATDVYAVIALDCVSGTAMIGVDPLPVATSIAGVDPRGTGGGGDPCPATFHFTGSVGPPKAPPQGGAEAWGYVVVGGPATVGTYSLRVLIRWEQVLTLPA
ncbi:MAG: hypothetical protein V4510_03905 [bacterium]